ncbi:MAG TPA: DMT family transporter [Myxococcaceae bacterium]|nr:DMT family transporter [Myxococcaceae bacterium]
MGPRPTSHVLSATGTSGPQAAHARGGPGPGVVAALLLQTAISAGTFLVAKRAVAEVPLATLVLWRFLLSGAVFALLVLVVPGPTLPPRRAVAAAVALGLLAGPLNQGLFFAGLARSTAAHAALLYALTPIGVYLYSVLRGREAPSTRAGLGLLLAFSGALVLLLAHGLSALSGVFVGDVLILGAVAAWVLYTAEGKPFIGEHGPLRATAWSMIAGALWMAPLAPWFLRPDFVLGAPPVVKGSILFLALLSSVVSYLLWYWALGRTDASKVAVFSNLQPVATAVAAWGLLGERIGWEVVVGGVLVLVGVRLTSSPRPAPPVPPLREAREG